MKKETARAFLLLLLIPAVVMAGGWLFSLINPEIAAGHPNYARNFHFLTIVRLMSIVGSWIVAVTLWLLACLLIIRSKRLSPWWMFFAAFGPFGFVVLMMLRDKDSVKVSAHERFVRSMNPVVRVGYWACTVVVIWVLAYEAMIVGRNLLIRYQSFKTGMSTAQIIDLQNASSGMWAFGEEMEVMFMVILLFLLWPVVFNLVSGLAATRAASEAR